MSNTYTQLYIHCVFAVKYREAVLSPEWDNRLRLYITAIVQNNGHKMVAINNMPDHLHMFIGFNPNQSLSNIIQLVKGNSSEWINKERLTKNKFNWQDGYGAFSYSRSQINTVALYIENQQVHHARKSFLDEYRNMLNDFSVDYDEKYIFREMV